MSAAVKMLVRMHFGRKPEPSLYAKLDAVSTELDELLREIGGAGMISQAQFDNLEARAAGIATRLRNAFRKRD